MIGCSARPGPCEFKVHSPLRSQLSKRRRSGFQLPVRRGAYEEQFSIASIAPRARLLSLSGTAATLCASGERRALPPALAAAHARRRTRERARARPPNVAHRFRSGRAGPVPCHPGSRPPRCGHRTSGPGGCHDRRENPVALPFCSGRPRLVCSAGPRPAFARPAAREVGGEKGTPRRGRPAARSEARGQA